MDVSAQKTRVEHCFDPVFDARSRVLVLGTMPSPMSRELGFYYSHPRNRFWSVLAQLLGRPSPESAHEKRALLLLSGIALWDVLKSCEIHGASDSSIALGEPNDLSVIFNSAQIRAVFTTGAKAAQLYRRFSEPLLGVKAIALPSTSPANARASFSELLTAYARILEYL